MVVQFVSPAVGSRAFGNCGGAVSFLLLWAVEPLVTVVVQFVFSAVGSRAFGNCGGAVCFLLLWAVEPFGCWCCSLYGLCGPILV